MIKGIILLVVVITNQGEHVERVNTKVYKDHLSCHIDKVQVNQDENYKPFCANAELYTPPTQ